MRTEVCGKDKRKARDKIGQGRRESRKGKKMKTRNQDQSSKRKKCFSPRVRMPQQEVSTQGEMPVSGAGLPVRGFARSNRR